MGFPEGQNRVQLRQDEEKVFAHSHLRLVLAAQIGQMAVPEGGNDGYHTAAEHINSPCLSDFELLNFEWYHLLLISLIISSVACRMPTRTARDTMLWPILSSHSPSMRATGTTLRYVKP